MVWAVYLFWSLQKEELLFELKKWSRERQQLWNEVGPLKSRVSNPAYLFFPRIIVWVIEEHSLSIHTLNWMVRDQKSTMIYFISCDSNEWVAVVVEVDSKSRDELKVSLHSFTSCVFQWKRDNVFIFSLRLLICSSNIALFLYRLLVW